MKELIQTAGDALVLKDEAFVRLRDSGDAFARGITLLVLVALIVGFITASASFVQQITAGSPEQQIAQVRQSIIQGFDVAQQFGAGTDPNFEIFRQKFEENLDAGLQIGLDVTRVVQQTTPLPPPIGNLFEAVGHFVSYPWGRIGGWMFYAILVLIAAKLLGGTATVQEMLGLSALYSVPHLLDALGFIPCIGFMLGIVAFFWGLVIYIKATAVANQFTTGKAVLAVFLPAVVLFLIGFIVVLASLGLLAGFMQSAGQ